MSAVGTVGAYSNLEANANAGENVLSDAGLAASLVPGDLVKITSDSIFNAIENVAQGEMAIVDSVSGSNIYLKSPLWDSYTTANTARIAKVTPVQFSISGKLTLENNKVDADDVTYGLRIAYALAPTIDDLTVLGTTYAGVIVASCYAPDIRAVVPGTLRTATDTSYGILIYNTTMYGVFRGAYFGHRHAVATGANAVDRGVSWGNKVIGVSGTCLENGQQIFDAHGSVGDIEFIDCTAHGGTMYPGPAYVRGFETGARHTRITNCRVKNCSLAVGVRSSCVITDLIIKDLEIENCTNGVYPNETGTTIANLVVDGVRGNLTTDNGSYYGVLINSPVAKWFFDNIRITNGSILHIGAAISVPALLEVNNSSCDGTTIPSSAITTWVGVRPSNANITHVRLNNVNVKNKSHGLYAAQAELVTLELNNCHFQGNYKHVAIEDADYVYIRGGSYLGHTHASADLGLINYLNTHNAEVLMFDGIVMDEVYVMGQGAGAVTVLCGVADFRTPITGLIRNNISDRIEIYGGGPSWARIISGNGSPEGAITAYIGALYVNRAGGESTTLYVKTSGSGNTGWTAK